jgi:hypothetical protein
LTGHGWHRARVGSHAGDARPAICVLRASVGYRDAIPASGTGRVGVVRVAGHGASAKARAQLLLLEQGAAVDVRVLIETRSPSRVAIPVLLAGHTKGILGRFEAVSDVGHRAGAYGQGKAGGRVLVNAAGLTAAKLAEVAVQLSIGTAGVTTDAHHTPVARQVQKRAASLLRIRALRSVLADLPGGAIEVVGAAAVVRETARLAIWRGHLLVTHKPRDLAAVEIVFAA